MPQNYTVTLETLTLQSDLKGVVLAVASILQIDKRVAVEKVKKLPLILASDCSDVQARLMTDMFTGMGAGVQVNPPLEASTEKPHHRIAEPLAPVSLIEEPDTHRMSWRTGVLIGVTVLTCFVLAIFGGIWVLEHVKPTPEKSMELLQKGKMSQAKRSLEKQLKQRPGNVELLVQKGLYYLGVARVKMDQAGWVPFGSGARVPGEGQDLMAVPEADTALGALLQAAELAPDRADVQCLLSLVYRQKNLLQSAETAARRAVELDPDDIENWNQLGAVLVDLEQYGPAEQVFYSALKLDSHDPMTIKNLGILNLYHHCDTVRAAAFISRYLESELGQRDQDRLLLRKDLIRALWAQFNPPMGSLLPDSLPFSLYEQRRRALVQRSDATTNALVQEELGVLFLTRRMDEPAQNSLLAAVRMEPKLESAWKMLVVVQMIEGNFDKTTNTLRAAVQNGVQDPFFYRNLGLFEKYWKLNPKAARRAWENYLSRSGDSWVQRVQWELQQ